MLKDEEALSGLNRIAKDPKEELDRFRAALASAEAGLTGLSFDCAKRMGEEEAEIFEAQKLILKDDSFEGEIVKRITEGLMTAEQAIISCADEKIGRIEESDDEFARERSFDIRDVKTLLLKKLTEAPTARIKAHSIVFAGEILPSMVVSFDRRYVKGIVTGKGTYDGHAALLARSLGIPMIAADYSSVEHGTEIALDAVRGTYILKPDKIIKLKYLRRAMKRRNEPNGIKTERYTVGHLSARLCANISDLEQGLEAAKTRVSGVGLFRTEEKKYCSNSFKGNYEIVSLTGTINTMNGGFYTHIHMSAGNDRGEVFGGHLNRAVIVEREAVPGQETVNVIPQPKAGGSFAATAYKRFERPAALEEIRADAGLDIGDTLIGMHLKKVAVPVRLEHNAIGQARVIAARTRPKFIGGSRAVYDDDLM